MSFLGTIKKRLNREVYYIGFLRDKDITLPKKERYQKVAWLALNGYKGGWFADPFFLSMENNHIQLLVEEMVYSTGRGILTHLDIAVQDEKYILKTHTPILSLTTHLSFPIIWRENEKVYVYPENWQGGALRIYEYDAQNKKLVNPIVLIEDPLVDSQIFKDNGKYYVVGSVKGDGASSEYLKCANVYVSDNLFGPYNHICTLTSDRKIERGAGEIYREGTDWIRPVQKCDKAYGEAVILNKLYFDGNVLEEKEIAVIEPDENMRKGKCLHTINEMNGLYVIDGRDYENPRLMGCIHGLRWLLSFKKK